MKHAIELLSRELDELTERIDETEETIKKMEEEIDSERKQLALFKEWKREAETALAKLTGDPS